MVGVRDVGFDEPDEKVAVALPVTSLTTELADKKPVSAEKAAVTSASAAFEESTTVAMMADLLRFRRRLPSAWRSD